MKDKELVRTDGIWYKVKSFFRGIFNSNKQNIEAEKEETEKFNEELNKKEIEGQDNTKNNFMESISYKKEIDELNRKEAIAKRMLNGEITSYDLTDEEVDEMTEYFMKDIEKQDAELKRIREHIVQMKKQLEG